MRKTLSWVAMPVLLVAVGLAARGAAGHAYRAFFDYHSPFGFHDATPARTSPRLTPQVVFVLVDGLAYDTSKQMPFLNSLRARGADVLTRVGRPSLSLPGRGAFLSGVWHDVHGQMTNAHARPLAVDHLFGTVHRAGLTTALAAGRDPLTVFGPIDFPIVYPVAAKVEERHDLPSFEKELRWMSEQSRTLLREREPAFFDIDLTIMDQSGHRWGAASPEYAQAAQYVDEELAKIAGQMDLTKSTLIISADHGHTPTGGHGGAEENVVRTPLVMVGVGIKPGSHAQGQQIDFAPTVASLLGVPIPSSNEGSVLLDTLEVSPDQRLSILRALLTEREREAVRIVSQVQGSPYSTATNDADSLSTEDAIRNRLAQLDADLAHARAEHATQDQSRRLPLALAVVLIPLLAIALALRLKWVSPSELGWSALGTFVAIALYAALFPLFHLGYSFSTVNKDELLTAFFQRDMALSVLSCTVACLVSGALLRRRSPDATAIDLAHTAWWITALFIYLFVIKIAVVHWRVGAILHWHVPDLFWGFGFYLDVLAVMPAAFCAPVMPFFVWLGSLPAKARSRA